MPVFNLAVVVTCAGTIAIPSMNSHPRRNSDCIAHPELVIFVIEIGEPLSAE